MVDENVVQEIKTKVEASREDIIRFLRDIIAIPSMNSQIKEVGERIGEEMKKLDFDEVRFDKMGNIMGRIGNGPKVMCSIPISIPLVSVTHMNGSGILSLGKIENGVFYGRGTCDEKGSTPGMVYGLAIARDLGLLDGWTAYYFGNMEEECDGIAPNSFVEVDPKVKPDYVIIGEPTCMNVYRGH